MTLFASWDDFLPENMVDDIKETYEDTQSYEFDFSEVGIVVNNLGKVRRSSNQGAYIFWVVKCICTERYSSPFYSTDYGVEIEHIIAQDYPRYLHESEIERTIKEALAIDPRSVRQEDFKFKWVDSILYINFIAVSIYGKEQIQLMRGGN